MTDDAGWGLGFEARLRERLILAALGSLAAACSDGLEPASPSGPRARPGDASAAQAAEVAPPPETAAAPRASAPSSAPVGSVALAPSASASVASAVASAPPPLRPNCYTPFHGMRSVGTGGPAPEPPPSAFDKNGCLPAREVSDTCCTGANGGPRFDRGQCCYTFPKRDACCGRPFVVGGEARVAEIAARADWLAWPVAGAPGDEVSARAAQRWLDDARMEHASIASFARFVTDLLALGAPAALVGEASAALADEIEHARVAFAIASRLAGRALGPGPLDARGEAGARDARAIVTSAVIEGCVGESCAATIAAARLSGARDPEIRAALARIAEDEARHAALAFRFVGWALGALGPGCGAWVEQALAEACEARPGCSPGAGREDDALRVLGVVPSEEERAIAEGACARVVRPALAALLARARAVGAARAASGAASADAQMPLS